MKWASVEGAPLPLGATWIPEERAYNFALYSKHATRVTLLLYHPDDCANPVVARTLDHLHHKSGRVWHCRLRASELYGARYYAYTVDGPAPEGQYAWHAFDPGKILLDPYAGAVFLPPAFDPAAAVGSGSNAGRAPLGVLPSAPAVDDADSEAERAPLHAAPHDADAIIYELHVRNFTRHPSSEVTPDARGTFAGVIEKIPYLVDLGITVVELMPVFQNDPGGRDRWGYMPLNFFALHNAYLATADPTASHREFRAMVDALHAAGIEVVLDVVYNHTCERGSDGPTYSFKGIDNSTYYLIGTDPREPYENFSGTGNTLNCVNHAVRKMILDSMRHWARLGVDGFRFDLASIYARGADGSLRYDDAPVLGEISGDPEFAGVRLIAEPWDAGASQLGRRFPGLTWQQWNGAFRDDLRRFVRGEPGMVPALMRRLYGSDDLFPDDLMNAYRPFQSVNYVTSHDGPTLRDLVSFNHKHNWPNGHDNRDGPRDTFSWNCGWEGNEHVPDDVERLRLRQARNYFALLLLANGTPMFRAGDEFFHSQNGNDNPYNQDDETTWLDWSGCRRHAELLRFVRRMIAFRKAHPSVSRGRFWRSDVQWYGPREGPDLSSESSVIAYCLHGASQHDGDLYVMINGGQEAVAFTIQEGTTGGWRRVIDTACPAPLDFCDAGTELPLSSIDYTVQPRSVVVLVG